MADQPTPRKALLSKLADWLPQVGEVDDPEKEGLKERSRAEQQLGGAKPTPAPVTIPVFRTKF